MNDKKFEYDEEGNLKIFKKWKNREKLHQGARNLLLLSDEIIVVERKIISEDTPKECNLIITVPFNFNIKGLIKLFSDFKQTHNPLSKIKYETKNNVLEINLVSGSKRCSFCQYFQEYLDRNLTQEIILINNPCLEWSPKLKEKIPEEEYQAILGKIAKNRLEYFANTTSKYRAEVMERDGHRCKLCGTDGKVLYTRRNGKLMTNPLQIHHFRYDEDSPNSLITLCAVCHFKEHKKMYIKTGRWSSKQITNK